MKTTLNYKQLKIDKNTEYWLGLIFTVIPTLIFALVLSNKTMPLAEGWYTYYAQIINEGSIVYKDFEYLFMPGYITFIALFTKIFGYNIIALRILGAIIFATIAYFAYKIFNELFNPVAACLGAVATAFYLQSEIVQIFYDYIRFMDLFAYITVFLLIKIAKQYSFDKNKNLVITVLAGMSNAMVLMTKQNIGLLFGFFVLCYFIFLFIYKSCKKNIFTNLIFYGIGAGIVFAGYIAYLAINGALNDCIQQTLIGASEAKGGIKAILFNWIIKGKNSFINGSKYTYAIIIITVVLLILNKYAPQKKQFLSQKTILSVFGALSVLFVLLISFSKKVATAASDVYKAEIYGFYLFIVLAFFTLGVLYLIDIFKYGKTRKYKSLLPIFVLLGSIFAIGYGVGMSGGLCESQIALSVGFIICVFTALCKSRFNWISMSLITTLSLAFIIFCGGFKLINTYSWWGLTSEDAWSATNTTKVPILKGIRVSDKEKELYDGIYDIVNDNTTEDDDIFVFPHCPVIYSMVNRTDPGTTSKVQWFDVSMNDTVKKDISVIEKEQPKVIVVYNIPQYVIDAHEKSFNKGKKSSTTLMYTFLSKYCLANNYRSEAFYKINDLANVTVWVKEDKLNWYSTGTGTKANPYTITNKEQFLRFAEMVNSGATFEGLYVSLACDIDLSNCKNFTPIGSDTEGTQFRGTFNGNGHAIKNLTIKKPMKSNKKGTNNVALFGSLSGKVINLGLENCNFSGYCVAGFVRYNNNSTSIINCYTRDCVFNAKYRAGVFSDDVTGHLYNCIAINTKIDADKRGALCGYIDRGISVVNCFSDTAYYFLATGEFASNETINSNAFADRMNSFSKAYENHFTTSKKTAIPLNKWIVKDGKLTLDESKTVK